MIVSANLCIYIYTIYIRMFRLPYHGHHLYQTPALFAYTYIENYHVTTLIQYNNLSLKLFK